MATEKTTKKKKRPTEGSGKGSAVEKATSAGGAAKSSAEPEMRSALLPLIWLLIPFVAVVAYGILTRE
jgi:hypothetical protein